MKPAAPGASGLFVSWASLRRAQTIADRLGLRSVVIGRFAGRKPLLIAGLKYAFQAARTLCLLIRSRPAIVFVTSPPFVAALTVFVYARLFGARFVIDSHGGCFLEEHWRRWDSWQRFLARRAAINLIHHRDQAPVLEAWGAPYLVFPSLPPDLEPAPSPAGSARPAVVAICSFKADEPVGALLEAARGLPDVEFFMTGRAPPLVRESAPGNVRLTGFLPDAEYERLLAGAAVIVALTTRPSTLLYAAQEAVALHKPLVLSRLPALMAHFTAGAVYADNTASGLRAAIAGALEHQAELAQAMAAFEARSRLEGEARLEELKGALSPELPSLVAPQAAPARLT